MKFKGLLLTLAIGSAVPALSKGPASSLSDAQVEKLIIRDSIGSYPGNCPCLYNSASNGCSYGRRSVWSLGGGYTPICYDDDVTADMLWRYRSRKS